MGMSKCHGRATLHAGVWQVAATQEWECKVVRGRIDETTRFGNVGRVGRSL